MLTDQDVRELLKFTSPHPVLSVYLSTDPTLGNKDSYRLRLRNMLKKVNLPQDEEAVERYIMQEYDWSGRGVAVFSCVPEGFFRAYALAVPVRDLVHVATVPACVSWPIYWIPTAVTASSWWTNRVRVSSTST